MTNFSPLGIETFELWSTTLRKNIEPESISYHFICLVFYEFGVLLKHIICYKLLYFGNGYTIQSIALKTIRLLLVASCQNNKGSDILQ